MRTTTLGTALVMGALCGAAACGGQKGSPTGPETLLPTPPPTVAPISLTISGNTSISDPGGTTRLMATARYPDGTTQDVTAEAQWSSNTDPFTRVVSVIDRGLIRAERYGKGDVETTCVIGGRAASATVQVRVAPDGVFLVSVDVSDHEYATDGARVQVTSPAGTFSATTNLWGFVYLPAVGNATLQVEKSGFRTMTQAVIVASDVDIDFVLQPSDGA